MNNLDILNKIISSLDDEEFANLLGSLNLEDKIEDVVVEEKYSRNKNRRNIDNRRNVRSMSTVEERMKIAKYRAEIRERLNQNKAKQDQVAKIKEKLELARKKRQIQERISNLRNK